MESRKSSIKIVFNGQDITEEISGYVKSFTFNEAISDKADTGEITLEDVEELWISNWFPKRGTTAEITIKTKNWYGDESAEELPLGKFEIDTIRNSQPPLEAKIKMVSIPNHAEIRNVERSRSWEKTQLSTIAKDVVTPTGMELIYDTADDPILERAEQKEQSDLSFLKKLCKNAGLALKVTDGKVIIFDYEKYEKQEPVTTLRKGESRIKSFEAEATIHEIYKACHVKYQHGKKGELIEYTFNDPNKTEGMTLEINEKVETIEEAEKLAKKKLREKNAEEITVNMVLVGDFILLAGSTVEIAGFFIYDGKYLITEAKHELGKGYVVHIKMRRCLNGY